MSRIVTAINMTDRKQIDAVFRRLDREVWIITAAVGQRRGGLLATWVSQASIDADSPVVLAGIARNHFTAELIDRAGAFALHLITRDQIDIAWKFALASGRDHDKLAGLHFRSGETGSPVLTDCLAWLDCRVFARLDGGDRIYYWADCLSGASRDAGSPLTEQDLIGAATDEQRQQLVADRARDVGIQRPLVQQWRAQLPAYLKPETG